MDYKDKVIALLNSRELSKEQKEKLESIFPELKESEDEESKKWILEYLYDGLRKSDEQFKGQFKAAIAWLEKQCKNNMGISEDTKQELEDNLNKALEKETPESWNEFLDEQAEQKPFDTDNKFIRMRETKPKDISEFLDRLTTVEQEFLWEHIEKVKKVDREEQKPSWKVS